jgi:hypothetical protein
MAVGLGAIAVVLALFVYAACVAALRMFRDGGRLRLIDALRGQGLALPEPDHQAVTLGAALAVRRCATCAGHVRCDELLAVRDWKALRAICPNTAYIDILRAGA